MKYSIHDHTVFASVFLLAVSRRKKQRDTSNRSGWPLCFRESSKTTKSHSNLCCPFASALGFPFFSISSSVILPSLFHSFTFIRSFHRLYFFFVYLLCYKHHDILTPPCHLPLMLSLSLPLSSFICHFTRPFVPLFRAISVQRRQANGDLSDCGAVLPLFLLFLLALTSAN